MTQNRAAAWAAALAQLSKQQPEAKRIKPFNPRPAGVIQRGSATDVVLQFLRERPAMYFAHHQIVAGTGRTGKAVDWALIYLGIFNRIEQTSEPRSALSRRYRAVPNPACRAEHTNFVPVASGEGKIGSPTCANSPVGPLAVEDPNAAMGQAMKTVGRGQGQHCGAMDRWTGQICGHAPEPGRGRCRLHGGASTGPKTEAGKDVVRSNGKRGGRPARNKCG